MSRLTRRQFIGRTALIAGTMPLFAWDEACQRANVTTSTLQTFRNSLKGTVVFPIDPDYADYSIAYNSRFHHAPMMFVLPKNAHDVAKAVQFSKAHGITLSPRGGGHNYCGWSTCDGMVIDFRDMADITIAADASTATVGPGALLLDCYEKLWCEAQCSLPGGTCPTVGLAGYTLGGGFGLYSRAWGLMCDRLREVQAVNGHGEIITATANNEHADLLRACRGGGGGSLCIVTKFVYEPVSLTVATLARFGITNFDHAAAFIDAYQNFAPNADNDLTCSMSFGSRPGHANGPRMGMSSVVIGGEDHWTKLMGPFLQQLSDAGVQHSNPNPVASNPAQIALDFARSGQDPHWTACTDDAPNAHHFEKHSRFKSTSVYINEPLTSPAIDKFVAAIQDRQDDTSFMNSASISMDCYRGQIAHEPEGGSVMYHRKALAVSQIFSGGWDADASQAYVKKNIDWIDTTRKNLAKVSSNGAYVNYCDAAIVDWETAYWGDQYPFLQQVKQKYDPDDVFHFPQSIRLP